MSNPFDYVRSINETKENLVVDDRTEKEYTPFLTNRALSYHHDTVFYANEMNIRHNIDNSMQYQYLLNIVRRRKRFSKWHKRDIEVNIEPVKQYFGFSSEKALEALDILTSNQIATIKSKLDKGGRNDRNDGRDRITK